MSTSLISNTIARCFACRDSEIVADWLPIGYFGHYSQANAWVLSINPSSREFLDTRGEVLSGEAQRFCRLSDFEGVGERTHLTPEHVHTAVNLQDSIFERVPYRPFFNRLGRFLLQVHDKNPTDHPPLTPFTIGIDDGTGGSFLYAHLDIVKCATATPWGKLTNDDQSTLTGNCSAYLEQQFAEQRDLQLVLVNGRTASEQIRPFLERSFRFIPDEITLDLGHTRCSLWVGEAEVQQRRISVIGWSANVVNQQLKASAIEKLIVGVRSQRPDLFGGH